MIVDDGSAIDFATLDARVEALSGWLRPVAGIEAGDVVAVIATNRPGGSRSYQAALVGAHRSGDSHLQADDATHVVTD